MYRAVHPGRLSSRLPAIRSASGRYPHSSLTLAIAARSAVARADDAGQQVRGIGRPHRLEHQPAEVLQAGQRAAAGDHDQAGAPARQQLADLAF
jgi:hypothetical protein